MTTTVLAYDLRFAKRAHKMSTRCLLAILLYSCNPSPGPGEPAPKPESPKAHTTLIQKENTNVAQQNSTYESTQHSVTPLDPQALLNEKLANPNRELSTTESISLIEHCAQLGEQNAYDAKDKEVTLALGNAGAGKSTTVNYLMGCKMKLAKPRELGLSGVKKVVVVDPESIHPEVMPIGHGSQSHTFMPQIASDPNNENKAYCDCPGFGDNRGAEINIANAINTRRVLQQATGVKAVFLTDYYGLLVDRSSSIRTLESMCHQMFGSADNLRRHQNAVLLGITKAPLYNRNGQPFSLNTVRLRITQSNTPTAQILASRSFLFDPLDRGRENPDFWSRERCRTEIAQLSSIPQREATTLFQTVLTGNDQTKLKHIMREQASSLVVALERDDYQAAESHLQSLTQLKIIGSAEVEQMILELAGMPLKHFVLRRVASYKEAALQHRFDDAEEQLWLLRMLTSHFPNTNLQVSLAELESLLTQCKERKAEAQRNTDQKLAAAKQEGVQEVREEMEQKVQQMLAQLDNMLIQSGFSASERQGIRTRAAKAGQEVLEGIGKNQTY